MAKEWSNIDKLTDNRAKRVKWQEYIKKELKSIAESQKPNSGYLLDADLIDTIKLTS